MICSFGTHTVETFTLARGGVQISISGQYESLTLESVGYDRAEKDLQYLIDTLTHLLGVVQKQRETAAAIELQRARETMRGLAAAIAELEKETDARHGEALIEAKNALWLHDIVDGEGADET